MIKLNRNGARVCDSLRLCFIALFVMKSAMGFQANAGEQPKPNIVLVMTDDQGYGDIRSHGNPYVRTPHQDRLAESGARFDRFFVSPVCAPTRASLLTGRYHLKTGVSGVTRGYENIRSEEVTIAEVLKGAGYRTACFGKWHNGRHMPMHPNGQGFDTFLGFCGGHWNTYFDPPLELNGTPVKSKGYIADVITEAAIEFIQKEEDRPWFCYVAYNTPHSPWRVPDKYWENYNGLGLDVKAQCAYAMVENIDDNLGRILDALRSTEQEEETIVLFLTDNGANSPRYNAGMLGRKGSVDEGGTRVPLFVRYPGVIEQGKTIRPIAFHLDLLPTLAEFCGITLRPTHHDSLDGVSLVPLLVDRMAIEDWPKRMLFTDSFRVERGVDGMKGAVRTDQYRATMHRGKWKLFDMDKDPGQEQDLSKKQPETLQELAGAFEEWFSDIDLDQLQERAIPVGHPSRRDFRIPANEADLVPGYGEEIQYTGDTQSGYANSWITKWTSEAAYPVWPIEVLQPGRYQLSIEYACEAENVGCQLEVSIGEKKQLVNVPVAHVASLQQKPDHLYSNNYQDKTSWATMNVGRFELSAGKAELKVLLKSKAGPEGIELNAVVLERLE